MSDIIPLSFDKDPLNLGPFCEKLQQFLIVEHDFVDGSLVVSLNAPFGSGKSTFLSLWKTELETQQEKEKDLPIPIILNAWESDYCGDPLMAVVLALMKAVHKNGGKDAATNEKHLREAAKDIGWFGVGMANKFVSHVTGLDPVAAGELAEKKKTARKKPVPDFISTFEHRMESLANLKKTLSDIFKGDSPKAFIFVDELDRCRPDYAISYLETIKHIFDVHGLVFVLALDYEQLGCSARALFGGDLNVAEYLRKFIQRSVSLPAPEEHAYNNLAQSYVEYYMERDEKRISMMSLDGAKKWIVELIAGLKMTPRQIQETFRIIGHTVSGDVKMKGKLYWCLGIGVMLMAALKVKDVDMYQKIGRLQIEHLEVCEYLMRILGREEAIWWIKVYLTGAQSYNERGQVDVEKILRALGYIKETESFNAQQELGDTARGWGMGSSKRFLQIFKAIENANSLA